MPGRPRPRSRDAVGRFFVGREGLLEGRWPVLLTDMKGHKPPGMGRVKGAWIMEERFSSFRGGLGSRVDEDWIGEVYLELSGKQRVI